jgi:hypothetical protein
VPYAQIWGTSSLLKKTNLQICSLNGDTLISIKGWKYPTGNPAYKDLAGVKVTFLASGKSVIRLNAPYNRNNLIGFLFDDFRQDLIVDNVVDAATAEAYISQFNKDEPTIEKALDYEQKEAAYLKNIIPIKKDTANGITVKLIKETKTPKGSIIEESEVSAGDVYLVSTYKLWTQEWVITFSRNVQEPLQVGNTETRNIKVATLTVSSYTLQHGGTSTLFTNMDGKEHEITLKDPAQGQAEKEITSFLIKKNYL